MEAKVVEEVFVRLSKIVVVSNRAKCSPTGVFGCGRVPGILSESSHGPAERSAVVGVVGGQRWIGRAPIPADGIRPT
jgi:hypothetical protein